MYLLPDFHFLVTDLLCIIMLYQCSNQLFLLLTTFKTSSTIVNWAILEISIAIYMSIVLETTLNALLYHKVLCLPLGLALAGPHKSHQVATNYTIMAGIILRWDSLTAWMLSLLPPLFPPPLSLSLSLSPLSLYSWAYIVEAGESVHSKDYLEDEIRNSKPMEDILDGIIDWVHYSKQERKTCRHYNISSTIVHVSIKHKVLLSLSVNEIIQASSFHLFPSSTLN